MRSSIAMDEEYMAIGAHIDATLHQKILSLEYVDFTRLIPRDKLPRDDQKYELVVHGGATFFAPVSERGSTSISNFSCWEQAFHIYSNILMRAYPEKASELIQYNYIIYTGALTYIWDNVYLFDREFWLHISKFPQRSWALILQQAWSMCLKDKVKSGENANFSRNSGKVTKIKEPCKRYNKGKCTFGSSCKDEHRCAVKKCSKFGHGAHICHLRENRDEGSSSSTSANAANK